MKLYKLTTKDDYTRKGEGNQAKWGKGVTLAKKPTDNPRLCSSDVIHAYSNVNLAFLFNPIHANIPSPQLWVAEGDVVIKDFSKVGCFSLTTANKLPTPSWVGSKSETRVRVMFATLCAEAVLAIHEQAYPEDGRPRQAIEAAQKCSSNRAAADYAADADRCAADADRCAAASAARAADYADRANQWAAGAAASAARAADHAANAVDIDFGGLADKAVDLIIGGGK